MSSVKRKYCFMINCNNNSMKSPEKNFFTVPHHNKAAWCEAAGLNHVPSRGLFICEDHLNVEEDLENYMYWKMMNVNARLKPQVPTLKRISQEVTNVVHQPSTSHLALGSNLPHPFPCFNSFCRVCLVQDANLYDIESCNLRAEYEAITSSSLPKNERLPQMLCWECRARLLSCARFRKKAILTQTILSTIAPSNKRSTKILANIDRAKYNLISSLVTKTIVEPDIEWIEAISQDPEPLIKVKEEQDSDDGVSDTQTYINLMEQEIEINLDIKLEPGSLEMGDPIFDDAQDFRESKKMLSTLRNENQMETKIDIPVLNAHDEANTSNKFICHDCGECFEVKSYLERHIYTHESIGTRKERRNDMNSLLVHQRRHTSVKKSHKCTHCKFKTVNSSRLKIHVNRMHGLNVLKCNICNYTCKERFYLMRHLRKHAVEPKRYKCDRCIYSSAKAYNLKRHLKLVHDFDVLID